ncbi:class F sortase [Geodermatophilus amargosae]|uniref:class F sortase n=1 Tax=Geodermatophilus amargosae TaxID=1296565 RepID=UPI0034DFAE86
MPPAPAGAPSSTPAGDGAVPTGDLPAAADAPPRPASSPVHLDIPRIGVDTPLVTLGLNPDGTVMVPSAGPGAPAGWYGYSASPGEPGPAVILGHVDSHEGPAVFSRLSTLETGDLVSVRRADGRTVDFVVGAVRTHPKSAFPTEAVYGATPEAVLRLITCGGEFDRGQGSYLSNVVVYASLAPASP